MPLHLYSYAYSEDVGVVGLNMEKYSLIFPPNQFLNVLTKRLPDPQFLLVKKKTVLLKNGNFGKGRGIRFMNTYTFVFGNYLSSSLKLMGTKSALKRLAGSLCINHGGVESKSMWINFIFKTKK